MFSQKTQDETRFVAQKNKQITDKIMAAVEKIFTKGEVIPGRSTLIKYAYDNALACYYLAISYRRHSPENMELAKQLMNVAVINQNAISFPLKYLDIADIYLFNNPTLHTYLARFHNFKNLLNKAFKEARSGNYITWLIDRTLDYLDNKEERIVNFSDFVPLLFSHGTLAQITRALSLSAVIKSFSLHQFLTAYQKDKNDTPVTIIRRLYDENPEKLLHFSHFPELLEVLPTSLSYLLLSNKGIAKQIAGSNALKAIVELYYLPATEIVYEVIDKEFVEILWTLSFDKGEYPPEKLPTLIRNLRFDSDFVNYCIQLITLHQTPEDIIKYLIYSFYAHVNFSQLFGSSPYFDPQNAQFKNFSDYKKNLWVLDNFSLEKLKSYLDKKAMALKPTIDEKDLAAALFQPDFLTNENSPYSVSYHLSTVFNALKLFIAKCKDRELALSLLKQNWVNSIPQHYAYKTEIKEERFQYFYGNLFKKAIWDDVYYANALISDKQFFTSLPTAAQNNLIFFAKAEDLLTYNSYFVNKDVRSFLENKQKIIKNFFGEASLKELIPDSYSSSDSFEFDNFSETMYGKPDDEQHNKEESKINFQIPFKSEYFENHQEAAKQLGINWPADKSIIKKKYRELAARHHPDKVKEEGKEEAKKLFHKINDAYVYLCDAGLQNEVKLQPLNHFNEEIILRMDKISQEEAEKALSHAIDQIDKDDSDLTTRKQLLIANLALYMPSVSPAYMQQLKIKFNTKPWAFIDEHTNWLSGYVVNTRTRETINHFMKRYAESHILDQVSEIKKKNLFVMD